MPTEQEKRDKQEWENKKLGELGENLDRVAQNVDTAATGWGKGRDDNREREFWSARDKVQEAARAVKNLKREA